MAESTNTATGMTCQHCVTSVTEEISDLDGAQTVEVDLASGRVTVTSQAPLSEESIRAAVTETGYQLAS